MIELRKVSLNVTKKDYKKLEECVDKLEFSRTDTLRMALREFHNNHIKNTQIVFNEAQEKRIREIIKETIVNIIK